MDYLHCKHPHLTKSGICGNSVEFAVWVWLHCPAGSSFPDQLTQHFHVTGRICGFSIQSKKIQISCKLIVEMGSYAKLFEKYTWHAAEQHQCFQIDKLHVCRKFE